jgi:inosine-uridine nucleoside N-ribohydrolase
MPSIETLTTAAASLMLCACVLWAADGLSPAPPKPAARAGKIPVILDTDIGDDIDDTWALALLLKSPEIDLKLVVTDQGKAVYRAKIIARFLQRAGRTGVAVGLGVPVAKLPDEGVNQAAWVQDYDLKAYPGKVHEDGVQAIIDTIMNSQQPVTVVAIGPLPTLAAALDRQPEIAKRARFVGMHGSVRRGYDGAKDPCPEYNVKANPKACRNVFTAPWDMTVTPLDTCGLAHLRGDKYARVRDSKDPVAAALIENYRVWAAAIKQAAKADKESTTLFDTVAAYLSFSEELLKMEKLGIRVTDGGMTVIDPDAKVMSVATEWKDMAAFEDFLVQRLTGSR